MSLLALALAVQAPAALAAGTTAKAPVASGVIDYPATFFAAASPNTAMDMINRLPGFSFDDGSQARGFDGSGGNVLIGGQRPASKSDDLASILTRIPAARVERIQLIRGGAPGIDMQGKAVMANVILRSGSGLQGDIVVDDRVAEDGRYFPDFRLEGAWRADGRTLEASLVSNGWPDDFQGHGPHTRLSPGRAVTDFSAMNNGGANRQNSASSAFEGPMLGGQLRANLLVSDNRYSLAQVDDFAVAGLQAEHNEQDNTVGELGVRYSRTLSSDLSLQLIGLQHLTRMNASSDFDAVGEQDRFKLGDTGGESIARAEMRWTRSDALALEGGGEFAWNWLRTHTRLSENGAPVDLPAANVLVTEKRGEAFLTATWRPSSKLTAEAGVRVEASVIGSSGDVALENRFVFPKPRVLLTWSPEDRDQFRLRVEREVGQLDFSNFVAQASLNSSGGTVHTGNPDLTPQQDWAFEATWERHFWSSGAVVLTARRLILSDVIDRKADSSGLFDTPANIGSGTENDLQVNFSLPLDRLLVPRGVLKGQWIWRSSTVTDPTTGEKRPISGQHPYDGELHFTQDIPARHMLWGVDFNSAFLERYFRFNEVDSTFKQPWWVLFVEWKPAPGWTFRGEWDDPTRRPVRFTRDVYSGPRSTGPLLFVDEQTHRFGQELFFQVRRTFGG